MCLTTYICKLNLPSCISSEDETDNLREKKRKASDETDGTGFKDILERDCKVSFNWGPKGFSKSNHPLAIMVTNLVLMHALPTSPPSSCSWRRVSGTYLGMRLNGNYVMSLVKGMMAQNLILQHDLLL